MSDRHRPAVLEGIATETARRAATLIAGAGVPAALASKTSPTDVVTQTDLDAETLIRQRLDEQTPGAGIIGEEGEGTAPGAELQWVVDPLDGTVNFLYGVPLFAVSIAAAINGTVVAGAVVDVLRGELFRVGRRRRAPRRPADRRLVVRGARLIIGATRGLGLAAARAAAARGAHVLVAGRSPEAVRATATAVGGEPIVLDLERLADVRAVAEALPDVEAVALNAGMQVVTGASRTPDGFETTFQVNHLAHLLLLDALLARSEPPTRIALTGSGTHDPARRTGMPPAPDSHGSTRPPCAG